MSGAVLQRACRRFQSRIELPQKPQRLGVFEATRYQWWQTGRKLCEASGSGPKSPSGMTFRWKILPSISGGSFDTLNNEFRARLSWIISPSCSPICSSNARMESRSTSRSIAVWGTSRELRNGLEGVCTHVCGVVCSLRWGELASSLVVVWMKEKELGLRSSWGSHDPTFLDPPIRI